MKNIAIWKLSTFCGFYGRVIPYYPHNNEDEKFNAFHTYTRNPDMDDLKVSFEPNLKPMTFMQLVADTSTNLYVMGHGDSWRNFDGKHLYEFYTMYTMQGLMIHLQNILAEEKFKKAWDELILVDQVKINID